MNAFRAASETSVEPYRPAQGFPSRALSPRGHHAPSPIFPTADRLTATLAIAPFSSASVCAERRLCPAWLHNPLPERPPPCQGVAALAREQRIEHGHSQEQGRSAHTFVVSAFVGN